MEKIKNIIFMTGSSIRNPFTNVICFMLLLLFSTSIHRHHHHHHQAGKQASQQAAKLVRQSKVCEQQQHDMKRGYEILQIYAGWTDER